MADYYCEVQEFTTDNPDLCEQNRKKGLEKCVKCNSSLVKLPDTSGKKRGRKKKLKSADDGIPVKKRDNLKVVEKKKKPKEEKASSEGEKCPGCGAVLPPNPVCICETCGDRFCVDCSALVWIDESNRVYFCPTCLDEYKSREKGTKAKKSSGVCQGCRETFPVDSLETWNCTIPEFPCMNEEIVRRIVQEERNDDVGVVCNHIEVEGIEAFIIHRLLKAPDVPDLQGEEALMLAQSIGNLVMEAMKAKRVVTNFRLEES